MKELERPARVAWRREGDELYLCLHGMRITRGYKTARLEPQREPQPGGYGVHGVQSREGGAC
jgi:hypothetical protein